MNSKLGDNKAAQMVLLNVWKADLITLTAIWQSIIEPPGKIFRLSSTDVGDGSVQAPGDMTLC